MFDTSKGALSLSAAAAAIEESVEDTKKLMYAGQLQGIISHKGHWWVLVQSIEDWLGHPLNVVPMENGD